MREMILNHVSLSSPNRQEALGMLRDIATGISMLVTNKVAERSLRSYSEPYQIEVLPNWSLGKTYIELLRKGWREEALLLMRLTTKAPLLDEIDPDVKERFLRCENRSLDNSVDGEPLVLCAMISGIAIGFPTADLWDKDRLTVSFDELLPDGNIVETDETIDNLTRSAHANAIITRHRETFREGLRTVQQVWDTRAMAFPHLKFGPEVEEHLTKVNQGHITTIIGKLAHLDNASAQWRKEGGASPPWETKVTDESNEVKRTNNLREARRFRSSSGSRELFYWHARYGSSGRIHLRFIRSEYLVEIGYIGEHLPL